MIKVYPYESLGHAESDWLNSRFHFSFADYYDSNRMGFGNLRVINDDTIQPGTGFDTHPHRDMEIITYVTEGAITHQDSEGNRGRTEAGDVQVMTAGSGIRHSEHNLESVETKLFQIWIKPNAKDLTPGWTTHQFPKDITQSSLSLLVSGDGNAPLFTHQDARIFAGNLAAKESVIHPLRGDAYIVIVAGELMIDEAKLKKGDGAEVTEADALNLQPLTDCKLLLIEV